MRQLKRLGLGCMGMSNRRNPEDSIKTIHTALDAGVTLLTRASFTVPARAK